MKQETQATMHPLAQFAATLQWSDVPEPVQRRAEDLWVDWFGSVLAGCKARPVASITRFALSQGPAQGPSEVIAHGATSSPMMAALANAAAQGVYAGFGVIQVQVAVAPGTVRHRNVAHPVEIFAHGRLQGTDQD